MTATSGTPRIAALSEAHPIELLIACGLTVAAAVAGFGWLVAHAAAGLAGKPIDLSLAAAIDGLLGWRHHLADPRLAFSRSARAGLPGPILMYVAATIVLTALSAVGWLAGRLVSRWRAGGSRGYATAGDIRRALSETAARTRGRSAGHPASGATVALGVDTRSRQRLFGAAEDSYLYLGPPRSGKGVHLIIPQTIDAPGSALVTATRPDTLRHTLRLRAEHGPVAVFDPQHLAGENLPRLRWAPQHGCENPLLAITRARALAAGAQLSPATVTDAEFWSAMTQAVLRCYLHAAALEQLSMRDVLTWTARPA